MNLPMPPLFLSSVLCLGGDAAFVALLTEAVRRLHSDVAVKPVAGLGEARAQGELEIGKVTLLALCDPAPSLMQDAVETTDADVLPRWAVVVFGREETSVADVAVVPRAEWNAALVAQVIRGALTWHGLRRENARLRGDLTTVGTRIAHDLRTPLGGMLTTTEMLREILAEQLPASVPQTQPILDSADGLVKLIERMSFIAKVTVSRERPQPCEMGTAFWNAYQGVESRLLKSGATLQQPARWPIVLGHPTWIEAVWRNLLVNAVEHGGKHTWIEAGWSEESGRYRFWLRNTCATESGKRPCFFPFHRMHEPGAARGLGLAIVHRLVEQEGGRCGFESPSPGDCCCFFTLPVPDSTTAVSLPTPLVSV